MMQEAQDFKDESDTLAAVLAVCGFNAAQVIFEFTFLGISAAFDKAGTMETYIGEGKGTIDGWWCVCYTISQSSHH